MPDNSAYQEYFQQVNSLPGQLGGLVTGLVQADAKGRLENVTIIQELAKLPNMVINSEIDLSIAKEVVKQTFSQPAIQNAILSAFLPTEAEITGNIAISTQTSSHEQDTEEGSASGSGSVGWGPFKFKATLSASMKCSHDNQRKSDQTSNMAYKIVMGRVEPPEGSMKIIDAMNKNTERILDIEAAVLQAQLTQAIDSITDGGGGGGGGGNNPPVSKTTRGKK